jgi:hypothetical protein
MGHPRQNEPLEVLEQPVERLSFPRRRRRELPQDLTGSYGGRDGEIAHVSHVIGHPVNQLMTVTSKFVW